MVKIKRLTALVFTAVFLLAAILPVYADDIDEARRKLQDVSRQINDQQSKIQDAKKKEQGIMGQLQSLEQSIHKAQNDIHSLDDLIANLKDGIAKTEKEIQIKEEELEQQVDNLSERLVFIYEKGGDVSYLEVLLSSTDIRDFLTRYDMLNCIIEQDCELIETINKERKELDLKKSELEIKKKELQIAKASQEEKKAGLDLQHQDKSKLLDSIKTEKEKGEQALEELERTSRQLEEMIRRSQSGEQLGTGTYTWPTPGCTEITSDYGMRYHPIVKERRMHTGVDIGAPGGANIVAVDGGTVISTGWMGAYGQVVIIDHGNGIATLYAHQSRILVSTGETVTQGQVIGKVGSTGWSTGPHLHFEVRINGQHTNPMSYIR